LPDGIFFKPKIPFRVYFVGPWNGKESIAMFWNILWPFGMYILWLFCNLVAFGIFFPVLVYYVKKKSGNL
jgi:hypothetical protein